MYAFGCVEHPGKSMHTMVEFRTMLLLISANPAKSGTEINNAGWKILHVIGLKSKGRAPFLKNLC